MQYNSYYTFSYSTSTSVMTYNQNMYTTFYTTNSNSSSTYHRDKIRSVELDDRSEVYAGEIPNCNIELMRHQRAMLKRCHDIEANSMPASQTQDGKTKIQPVSSMGVIADKVGSGKSYVILSMFLTGKEPVGGKSDMDTTITRYGYLSLNEHHEHMDVPTNLLVVPHVIKGQWVKYIDTFGSDLTTKVIDRVKLMDQWLDAEPVTWPDVVLVSSSMFPKLAQKMCQRKFESVRFRRLVIDEADSCKITSMDKINTQFTWLVTASWMNIMFPMNARWGRSHSHPGITSNSFLRRELMYLFSRVPVDITRHMFAKNNDSYVEACLALPAPYRLTYMCKTPKEISILHGNAAPDIIDALHAGDIQKALSMFNQDSVGTEDNIVGLILEKYTKERNNLEVQIDAHEKMEFASEQAKEDKLVKLHKKKQEIVEKIANITSRITDNVACNICFMDDIPQKSITKCCNNIFCMECIANWMSKSASTSSNVCKCPMCREPMNQESLYVMSDDAEAACPAAASGPTMSKNEQVMDIIQGALNKTEWRVSDREDADGASGGAYAPPTDAQLDALEVDQPRKIIVFSNYGGSLDNIEHLLKTSRVKHHMIKGSGSHIEKMLHDFETSQENTVLLMNSDYCGSGLNLQMTTDVILTHKFQCDLENQVIGRAQRPGRTSQLRIHYVIHKNEK